MKRGLRVYRPGRGYGYGWVVGPFAPRPEDHVRVWFFAQRGIAVVHTWALQPVDKTTEAGWRASRNRQT